MPVMPPAADPGCRFQQPFGGPIEVSAQNHGSHESDDGSGKNDESNQMHDVEAGHYDKNRRRRNAIQQFGRVVSSRVYAQISVKVVSDAIHVRRCLFFFSLHCNRPTWALQPSGELRP